MGIVSMLRCDVSFQGSSVRGSRDVLKLPAIFQFEGQEFNGFVNLRS